MGRSALRAKDDNSIHELIQFVCRHLLQRLQ